MIFGEGIVNDAVAIILFNTILKVFTDGEFSAVSTIGNFLLLGIASIGIGIIYGLIASYIFKHLRFISTSAIKETLVIFCFGYMAYATSEACHFSGIISQLTSGIVMAHYAWYSLSPQGKHMSSATFQVLGFGFEAFVFSYLGLTFFAYYDYPWSWQFISIEILIIIVGRIFGTIGLIYVFALFGHKKSVSFREICFISYAGMIRGAIAFGLVLRLADYHEINENSRKVITTTALTLVVFTTVVFGSLMPLVQ